MEYKVKISWDELNLKNETPKSPIEREQAVRDSVKAPLTKSAEAKSNDVLKQLQIAGSVYAFGRQGAGMAVNVISMNNSFRGETLKSERLQVAFNNVSQNIGLGLGVGMSLATGNPIAVAMTAYGLAQRAFNLALETRKYQAELSAERYRAQYYQNRLIKDISEVR